MPSTPGIELATSRSVGKRSPHGATYASDINTFSCLITYSRLKCPKTPVFPSSVAHSHFDLFAALVFVCSISVICSIHLLFAMLVLTCSVLFFMCSALSLFAAYLFICSAHFLFAAFLFCLQRFFFFCLQRFFFVCSVSFLFAAFFFCLQRVPCRPSYFPVNLH